MVFMDIFYHWSQIVSSPPVRAYALLRPPPEEGGNENDAIREDAPMLGVITVALIPQRGSAQTLRGLHP
jgi:hypothetical protein